MQNHKYGTTYPAMEMLDKAEILIIIRAVTKSITRMVTRMIDYQNDWLPEQSPERLQNYEDRFFWEQECCLGLQNEPDNIE